MLAIYVVSDATGETVERIVRSALVQFKKAPAKVVRRGHVRTPKQLRELVREAADQNSLILHTLVSHELRRLMLMPSTVSWSLSSSMAVSASPLLAGRRTYRTPILPMPQAFRS